MEETPALYRNGGETERQKEGDARDADGTDGTAAASEPNFHPRGPRDRHKFHTLGHQRRTKQKVVTDFTTVSKGTSAGVKPRAALKQVLFNQNDKNAPTEERGQLDLLKQALEGYAVPVDLKWKWKEELHGATLEKSWKDLVHSHSTMSKMQRHQQEALWEFVHTELTYINRIIIITDLVIAALDYLHQRGFLLEVKEEKLFSNLPDVLNAHKLFWQEVIFPMLHEVRTTGKPFDPMMLEAGCLQFHHRFSSYQHYCWEEEENLEFARHVMESNLHFVTYVQWVETHPLCSRMRLGDMQAKPHQRITKYPLLLKAVLKNTQDPSIQHRLKGMWSSVNTFLESINEYLRQKDEDLALHISALRLEGYEMEGINEEIDKQMREICRFDLTCPIKGVGRGVVRKLLLEENLKIRGRKDSKLEVVALLFSDVLLVTKVQKKGEKLKVVRPPLALDRTFCMALKDTVSFVLVEVGELQCAMNVYIFSAGTSERCSTWVATIKQAKENLRSLRELETKRLREHWRIQTQEEKPATVDANRLEEVHAPEDQDEPSLQRAGISELAAPKNQLLEDEMPDDVGPPFWKLPLQDRHRAVLRKSVAGRQQSVPGYEWIEMGVRSPELGGSNTDEDETVFPLSGTRARNQRARSVPLVDVNRLHRTGRHSLIPGGYPDVDYPTDTQPSEPDQTTKNGFEFGRGAASTSSSSTVRSSTSVDDPPAAEPETPTEVRSFSSSMTSPRLRRRRPLTSYHGLSNQFQKPVLRGSAGTWSVSSNSDSDGNSKKPPISDARKVLKLGSLKSNQGMFWNMYDSRERSEPQIFSDTELPHVKNTKRPKLKPVRRSSIPNITTQEEAHPASSFQRFPQVNQASNPNGHSSPLEGLLQRAKARNGEIRRDRTADSSLRPPASPSFSTTPSPSASDVDRDTEWEDQVEVIRRRALTVSKGWKEQLVDGDDEDDERNSLLYSNGVNVDWSGWCFDDDEVMDQLQPSGQGLLEGITQSLTWDLHYVSEQEEGEYSQV
ncbi:uncharacterized protein plekhg6 [Neosynchiropus ocellatus]